MAYSRAGRAKIPRALRGRRVGLSGVLQPCADSWFEDDAMGRTYWCQDRDSQTNEPIGEPYVELRSVQTHVDAASQVVNVPGAQPGEAQAVNYQERVEYVVPWGSQVPSPASDPDAFQQYVDAARQGEVYRHQVGAGEVTQPPRFTDAGAFDPRRDYVPGFDPRTGEQYLPEEDPGFPVQGNAPGWWEEAAYGFPGTGGSHDQELEASAASMPLILGLGVLGAVLVASRKKRRR